MIPQTKLEKIIQWFWNLPQIFCRHRFIVQPTPKVRMFDAYGNYYGECLSCGKSFRIIVPKDDDNYMEIVNNPTYKIIL